MAVDGLVRPKNLGISSYGTDLIIPENRKTSYKWHTLVGNTIVDHSDVVAASPVGVAPTTSSFSLNTWLQCIAPRQQLQAETRNIQVLWFGASYIRDFMVRWLDSW